MITWNLVKYIYNNLDRIQKMYNEDQIHKDLVVNVKDRLTKQNEISLKRTGKTIAELDTKLVNHPPLKERLESLLGDKKTTA